MTRRRDSDRKSQAAARKADADDLPMLEAIVDDLEQVAGAAAVTVQTAVAGETGFDTAIELSVPPLEKAAMAEAVGLALARAIEAAAALVRNHRVAVRFVGDTLIGSAVRDVVHRVLVAARARKIVVRRGYGDELLHDVPGPTVQVERKDQGDTIRLEIATGELEAADLPAALQSELVAWSAQARGRRLQLVWQGAARPDAAMRELLTRALADAGALRVTVGERVLFDRELEDRVRVAVRGDDVRIDVAPALQEQDTLEALAMVLPRFAERLAGRVVSVQFAAPARPGELASTAALCQQAAPRRLEIATAAGVDRYLPRLCEVVDTGGELLLRVVPGGRDAKALALACTRECRDLAATTRGRQVVVEWTDEATAGAADECLRLVVAELQPKTLQLRGSSTAEPEPIWPPPFVVGSDAAVRTLRVDTDVARPAQLLAAIERRLPRALADWRAASARLQIVGSAPPSRTLVRTLVARLEAAGVQRLEVDDHGAVDVVLPPLLQVHQNGSAVRLGGNAAGRDAAQVETALVREAGRANWTGASVTVADSPLQDRLVQFAVERGAGQVLLDGREPVQVHPRLLTADRAGDELVVTAQPVADGLLQRRQLARELQTVLASTGELGNVRVQWPGAGTSPAGLSQELVQALVGHGAGKVWFDGGAGYRQVHPVVVCEGVVVLGRKDDGPRPMLVLGVDEDSDPSHAQRVQERLVAVAPLVPGRCVLLVARDGGGERAVAEADAAVAAVRAVVDSAAAATLVFRGADARGRPHFQVVHSAIEGMAVGAAFADPRRR